MKNRRILLSKILSFNQSDKKVRCKMKVILDLDTGIDDAMALAYTLGRMEMELIGVTGTYGNVYTEMGVQNVLNLLAMFDEEDIPVFAGETHALYKETFIRNAVGAKIHGKNGVGEVEITQAKRQAESKNAVDFMIESITKYEKDLTMIATGPLTNLAKVLQTKPEIKQKIGRVVIMGGALTVPGNVSPYAEANIAKDPEAAKLVFESGIDVTMVGLDVTQRSQLTKVDTQIWRELDTVSGRIYADMVDYYISQHTHSNGTACYLHDPSAAICALHPEWFTMLPMYMTVVTEGEAAGRTIGDNTKLRTPNPNVKVCVGVASGEVEQHLKETFLCLFA